MADGGRAGSNRVAPDAADAHGPGLDGADGDAAIGGAAPGERQEAAPAPAVKAVAKRRKAVRRLWTTARQALFLQHLAQTANVAASCRAAGMKGATGGLYVLRQKSAEFRASWAAALREGYAALEVALLDRALNGTPTPIIHGGELKGTAIQFSERLAMFLINAHRDTVARIGAADEAGAGDSGVQALLIDRLAEMRARIDAEEAGEAPIETKAMPARREAGLLLTQMRAAARGTNVSPFPVGERAGRGARASDKRGRFGHAGRWLAPMPPLPTPAPTEEGDGAAGGA